MTQHILEPTGNWRDVLKVHPAAEFFPLLGVAPLMGRVPAAGDDRPGAPVVVVLSYQLWQRRFAGEASVVGRVVQLNDRPAEIIGVMPLAFRFIQQNNDVWIAYRLDRNQHSTRLCVDRDHQRIVDLVHDAGQWNR